ncbi:MAG TPA: allantoate amidohydrolase [Candidatus Sulfotelmatobacter sp.]|nr:allantoate amidohydrolase [Candidatus Sulfotelmatobacter sp.]
MDPAQKIMRRCDALGKISEEPGCLTRTYASASMRRANDLVAKWMREAGMKTRVDAIGNLIGHYDGNKSNAKILLLGSHLDTVRNAGKFDGPLGVLLAIACVDELRRKKVRPPFAIEVVGFCDEEGARFQVPYLGSKALAGCFDTRDLGRKDAGGVSMAECIEKFGGDTARINQARFDPVRLLGYLEAHIEQGPVLEQKNLAVGIVSAIAGQTRARVTFTGRAGHAGTTPMNLRKDALCAAAEMILAVETFARNRAGLVATVGEIFARPGAGNVIPGDVQLSLDVRQPKDKIRRSASRALEKWALRIAARRKLKSNFVIVHETAAVSCSKKMSALLKEAVGRSQRKSAVLASGAGHDAAIMAGITPAAMLFIRCKNGISHHPAESVKTADVRVAFDVMTDFLQLLAAKYPNSVQRLERNL